MSPFQKSVFPVCGLLLAILHFTAQAANASGLVSNPLGIRMDIGYTYDDNVSRSNEAQLPDHIYSLHVSKGMLAPLSDHTRLALNGMLGGERYTTHRGLGRVSVGLDSELMYRASGQFGAPTWSLFARAFRDQYKSTLRDGSRFALGLSVRQPLTDRITLKGAVSRNVRNAEHAVFDTQDTGIRVNLDYSLTSSGTIYVSGEHRRGDIVFSMKSDMAVGEVRQLDDVLAGVHTAGNPIVGAVHLVGGGVSASTGTQYFDYRMRGKTGLITLGYNHAFGSHSSIDLSWRRIESTPDLQPGYTPPSYISNQISWAYLMIF